MAKEKSFHIFFYFFHPKYERETNRIDINKINPMEKLRKLKAPFYLFYMSFNSNCNLVRRNGMSTELKKTL